MSIVLQSSGGGSVTIQEPTTASNLTATLPSASGTVMVSGAQPAFSAYQNSAGAQTISSGVATKVVINTEEFDTANCFDSTTNYRFTPNVAGYYQINFGCGLSGSNVNGLIIGYIYKNGSSYKSAYAAYQSTTGNGGVEVNTLVYCNGTTDYLEFYIFQSTGGGTQPTVGSNSGLGVWASGTLVRAA